MLVCDDVMIDQASGKTSIFGSFADIRAPKVPAIHPRLTLHIELTDGRGEVGMELRLVHADTDEKVFSAAGACQFPDPRVVASLNFTVNNVLFPRAGEYRFQLYAEGTLLLERRVTVHVPKEESEDA